MADRPRRTAHWALLIILLALALYITLTVRAAYTLTPTYDEPLHSASAWNIRYANDLRLNDEDPALWQQFVSLFLLKSDLPRPISDVEWADTNGGSKQADGYFNAVISPRPEGLILHARFASIAFALGLGLSLVYIAWRVKGPVAAAAVAVAFSLEPLLLAHGPIVKNDIPIALVFLWGAYLSRDALKTPWAQLAPLVAVLAVAPLIKFSGFLLWPAVALVLLVQFCKHRGLGAGLRIAALAAITPVAFFALTWLTYGLRFAPGPHGEQMNTDAVRLYVLSNDLRAHDENLDVEHPPAVLHASGAYRLPLPVRLIGYAEEKRLLPQAFCSGFTYMYGSSLYRRAYLLGQQGATGWWYYFPIAFAVKTPLTLLALYAAGGLIALRKARWKKYGFLIIPPALYAASAMTGHLNIGLRHLLPLYPFLLLGLGLLIAYLVQHFSPRTLYAVLGAACLLLALEVLPYSNRYLSYFNLPASLTSRNGLLLLGDSNLDWGQDTYRLLDWRAAHPNTVLYTYLFGFLEDPAPLGVRAIDVTKDSSPHGPGFFAISATRLQGIYATGQRAQVMRAWREARPDQVLGGNTLYLFSVPNTPNLGPMH